MISLSKNLTVALTLAGVLSSTSIFAQDDWRLNNRISIGSDFIYMRRSTISNTDLVMNYSNVAITNQALMNDMWFEPGVRGEVIGYFTEHSTVQLVASYLHHNTGRASVSNPGAISFPFSSSGYASDYTAASTANASYTTRFYDAECNYIYHLTPQYVDYFAVAGIIGLRAFSFRETLNLQFIKNADSSNFDFRTRNLLGGFQLGGNLQVNFLKWWSWDFTVKVAAMANWLESKVYLGNLNNTQTLRNYKSSKTDFAVLANPRISTLFHPSRYFSINVGYEAIILNDVAVAGRQVEDQKDVNAGATINDHGLAVFHGLSAGVNLSF